MNSEDQKKLRQDCDGLATYEYLANNIEECDNDMDFLLENLTRVDLTGQFIASTARYLHAIDPDKYALAVSRLVAATIDKDREHKYLPDILSGIYGPDYQSRSQQLILKDDNFRRIYKRLFPNPEKL